MKNNIIFLILVLISNWGICQVKDDNGPTNYPEIYKFDSSLISPKVNMLVSKFIKRNIFKKRFYNEKEDKIFSNFITEASDSDLIKLTYHNHGAVRCYAFYALSFRNKIDLLKIIENHIDDYVEIEFKSVDKIGICSVLEFYVKLITTNFFDETGRKLNEKEKEKLDSILQKSFLYKNKQKNRK